MTTRIGVAIRVRPLLEQEKKMNMKCSKLYVNPEEKEIRVNSDDYRNTKIFKFDKVFDQDTTQQGLYNDVQIDDLVNKVVEGYHCTIFAYGQTGSGKTHTMEGYKYTKQDSDVPMPKINSKSPEIGVIPRAIHSLYETIESHSKLYNRIYTVYCSFLQIYNEKIFDLLNPMQLGKLSRDSPGLRMRWTPKEQFQVENLFVFDCKNAKEAMHHFHAGIKNKIMASHRLNLASSRSHSILSFRVESTDMLNSESTTISKLDLVDLAGSERISLTGNDSQVAQKESIEINKSLFTLRQVISVLADSQKSEKKEKQSHIPYRDSKLTSLLKQSIGGNSFCLMIACLSPADRFFEENISTLTYATKAAYISNEPIRNDDPKSRLINDLKSQIYNLTKELEKANEHINFLSQITNEKAKSYGIDFVGAFNNGAQMKSNSAGKHPAIDYGGINDDPNLNLAQNHRQRLSKDSMRPNKTGNETNTQTQYKALENIKSPEALYERLIESINTVRDLLKSNKEIREKMEGLGTKGDQLQGEIIQLHSENQDLRDKLSVYESVISSPAKPNPIEDPTISTNETGMIFNTSNTPINKQGMVKDLMNLKKDKKILEHRIRSLEMENSDLQQKVHPKTFHLKEPKRSLYEMSQNLYDYNQALLLKQKFGVQSQPGNSLNQSGLISDIGSNQNENQVNMNSTDRKLYSMSPNRAQSNHSHKLASIYPNSNNRSHRSNTPLNNKNNLPEVNPALFNINPNAHHQAHRPTLRDQQQQDYGNQSIIEQPKHYLREDPLSFAFRKPQPNSTLQKHIKRTKPRTGDRTSNLSNSLINNSQNFDPLKSTHGPNSSIGNQPEISDV